MSLNEKGHSITHSAMLAARSLLSWPWLNEIPHCSAQSEVPV
jgi:hypothetical protein